MPNHFNGKNMDGWLARGGAPEHEWDAASSVAIDPNDTKLLATTSGEGNLFQRLPLDEPSISTPNRNTATANCT